MRRAAFAALAIALAACGNSGAQPKPPAGQPLETRPPNKDGETPAFPGQTRAPHQPLGVAFDIQTIAAGLDTPWGLAFLPDGRMLVTEKPGRLRIVTADGKISPAVGATPAVYSEGQGGLLDVALSPTFARDRLIYLSFAEPGPEGTNGTAVGRGRLVEDAAGARLDGFAVIYRQTPKMASRLHFGSRLVFAPDGNLFVTQGERSILPGRMQAQQLDSLLGKLVRIRPDGSIPADNPFVGKTGAAPQIWSYGHRSVQGAAINPATGRLWTIEFGAKGGDEINQPEKGKDYGWPTITYGTEYSGAVVGEGLTQKAGMEQPLYYWDPTSAPSGLAFYNADLFPKWKGSLFFGGHNTRFLGRLSLNGTRVVGEEHLLDDFGAKIRDVRVGPDGALYLLSDDPGGRLLKLVPKG
jgi:glucose/arabinose dehydrogenase